MSDQMVWLIATAFWRDDLTSIC